MIDENINRNRPAVIRPSNCISDKSPPPQFFRFSFDFLVFLFSLFVEEGSSTVDECVKDHKATDNIKPSSFLNTIYLNMEPKCHKSSSNHATKTFIKKATDARPGVYQVCPGELTTVFWFRCQVAWCKRPTDQYTSNTYQKLQKITAEPTNSS